METHIWNHVGITTICPPSGLGRQRAAVGGQHAENDGHEILHLHCCREVQRLLLSRQGQTALASTSEAINKWLRLCVSPSMGNFGLSHCKPNLLEAHRRKDEKPPCAICVQRPPAGYATCLWCLVMGNTWGILRGRLLSIGSCNYNLCTVSIMQCWRFAVCSCVVIALPRSATDVSTHPARR